MANIINIETSAESCTVALGVEGEVVELWEDPTGSNHSRKLAPFAEDALAMLARRGGKPDAVAVSIGPGSYTGLRIGLSFAKGLCYSLGLPLIGLPTLRILAVKAMFSNHDFSGDEIIIPMIDARRMEVYTAAYDFSLQELDPARPLILAEDSFKGRGECGKRIFIGSGSAKAKGFLVKTENDYWLSTSAPSADVMVIMAEKAYRENDFMDLAYSVPLYLKEYEAKHSVNKVLEEALHKNKKRESYGR